MKCITKGNKIRRVSNDDAALLVEKDGWKYTNKSSWKRAIKEAK